MVFSKEKVINGKKYYYASKSIRLSNGKVTSVERIINNKSDKLTDSFLEDKEKILLINYAIGNYTKDNLFNENKIKKIEEMNFNYKKILKKLTPNQKKDLWNRFTANFTFESNAIEGNSLTLKDVTMTLFEKLSVEGKDLREIYETKNTRDVLELVISKKFKFSVKNIIGMHKLLVRDMGIMAGFKKIPNYLVGRKIDTTPPEKVSEEINELIDYFKKNRNLHPIKLAANIHGLFEKIHPFDDGNGRVGRFLINVVLIECGYMPLIIRKSQRTAYFKCLEDFDNGYKRNLEKFLVEKYENTYKNFFEEYLKYV
ncbi:MAG: Fic family protein [Candidatus ainarchaeum sp.]|nr:Fic family protein [Candidatus ainarchaeum sp.]